MYLLTAALDTRAGEGRIGSRIGLSKMANTFAAEDDLYVLLGDHVASSACACVFVDEAQFLSKEQVWQLARFVDDYNVPVMCYGLRVDFRGELFPGSAALLAIADEMREVRTICWCGKKAGMVVRRGADGKAAKDGEQVQIGGNNVYVSLCRRHWRQEVNDQPPKLPKSRAALQAGGGVAPIELCEQASSEENEVDEDEMEAATAMLSTSPYAAVTRGSAAVLQAGGDAESPK